jgi:hypothetical protein
MVEKEEKLKQVKDLIEKLDNKNFSLYFFTLDTKGNPTAGIANIYEHVKVLNDLGYNAIVLHEKNDYKLKGDEAGMGIADWLGEEYASLPHASIENQNLNISPADFIIIPEMLSSIMDQIKGFPCRKIVLSQSYNFILDLLPIGKRWDLDYGFTHVITTSEKQADYVKNLFPLIRTSVVPVSIPEYFNPSDKPKIPVIAILTRNQSEAAKIAKSFYLQYPMYKWVTFKELRGLSRKQFASELGKCCLAVWVDDESGFGTFPIEALECKTPIIGKIPNMIPEWMEVIDEEGNVSVKNNGIWTNTNLNIPELIATYMKVWLEDAVPSDLLENIDESKGAYTQEKQVEKIKEVYEGLVKERINEFNNVLAKETTEAQ